MNRRRFFGLSLASVGAAVVAPRAAIKALAKSATRPLFPSNVSMQIPFPCRGFSGRPLGCVTPYSFYKDISANQESFESEMTDLIEHEAWCRDGVSVLESGRGTND